MSSETVPLLSQEAAVNEAFYRANLEGRVYPDLSHFPSVLDEETCREIMTRLITGKVEAKRSQFFCSDVKVAALPGTSSVSYAGDEEAACLWFTGL